jgi:uncharacterized membrane protein
MLRIMGAFFAGIFLFNAIPHLVQGICGKRHMTPFSPLSSALVNVVWGLINIVLGVLIVKVWRPVDESVLWCAAFLLGGVVISVYLAIFWSNPDARLPWHKK